MNKYGLPSQEEAFDKDSSVLASLKKSNIKSEKILVSLQSSNSAILKQLKSSAQEKVAKIQLKEVMVQSKAIVGMKKSFDKMLVMMKDAASESKSSDAKAYKSSATTNSGGTVSNKGGTSSSPLTSGLVGGGVVTGALTAFNLLKGKLKGLTTHFKSFGKILGKAGAIGMLISSGMGIITGFQRAGDIFNTEIPTMQEKISASIGGIVDGFTLGLVDGDEAARQINKVINLLADTFTSILESDTIKNLKKTATELWEGTKDVAKSVGDIGSSAANNLKNSVVGQQVSELIDKVDNYFSISKDFNSFWRNPDSSSRARRTQSGGSYSSNRHAMTKKNEGFRSQVYKDSLGNDTIGYGHLLTDAEKASGKFDNGITRAEGEKLYKQDANRESNRLYKLNPWLRNKPKPVRDAMEDMAFNMGGGFLNTKLKGVKQKLMADDYAGAAASIRSSLYAKQVGARADRNATMIENSSEANIIEPANNVNMPPPPASVPTTVAVQSTTPTPRNAQSRSVVDYDLDTDAVTIFRVRTGSD